MAYQGKLSGSLSPPAKLSGALHIPDKMGDPYKGSYSIAPKFERQELETSGKYLNQNVSIEAIYVSEAENPAGGNTVYIGGI